eukprot:SAG11_NODE_6128_length_1383_cov_1.317757_1_plen_312_part_10
MVWRALTLCICSLHLTSGQTSFLSPCTDVSGETDSGESFGTSAAGSVDLPEPTLVDLQCAEPYGSVSDSWRTVDTANAGHGDSYFGQSNYCNANYVYSGVGNSFWYRVSGPAGNSLLLEPPPVDRCGTNGGAWLTDLTPTQAAAMSTDGCEPSPYPAPACEGAIRTHSTPGTLPSTDEGVVERVVCIVSDSANTCYHRATVSVVNCNGFILFRLPTLLTCDQGYCTSQVSLPAEPSVSAQVGETAVTPTYEFPYVGVQGDVTTTVTFSATDSNGTAVSCDVVVTVTDTEAPVLSDCSGLDVVASADAGQNYG